MAATPENSILILEEGYYYENYSVLYEDYDDNYWEILTISRHGGIGLGTAFLCTSVFIILGNILTIASFCIDPILRSKTSNWLLLNLALSDLGVGMVSLPLYGIWLINGTWPFGKNVCLFWSVVDLLCVSESVFSIVIISMDRYLMIKRGVDYELDTAYKKKILLLLVFSWVAAWLLHSPAILGAELWPAEIRVDFSEHCYTEDDLSVSSNKTLVGFSITFQFVLPLLLLIYFNVSVYLYIKRSSRQTSATGLVRTTEGFSASKELTVFTTRIEMGSSSPAPIGRKSPAVVSATSSDPASGENHKATRSTVAKHKRAAKNLAVLVGVYLLCWTPYEAFNITYVTAYDVRYSEYVPVLIYYIQYLNSMINPLLYAYVNTRFKVNYQRILCFFMKTKRQRVASTI